MEYFCSKLCMQMFGIVLVICYVGVEFLLRICGIVLTKGTNISLQGKVVEKSFWHRTLILYLKAHLYLKNNF